MLDHNALAKLRIVSSRSAIGATRPTQFNVYFFKADTADRGRCEPVVQVASRSTIWFDFAARIRLVGLHEQHCSPHKGELHYPPRTAAGRYAALDAPTDHFHVTGRSEHRGPVVTSARIATAKSLSILMKLRSLKSTRCGMS